MASDLADLYEVGGTDFSVTSARGIMGLLARMTDVRNLFVHYVLTVIIVYGRFCGRGSHRTLTPFHRRIKPRYVPHYPRARLLTEFRKLFGHA